MSHSDTEKATEQFASITRIMMLVILTVTTAVAALFFEMIHQRVLAVVAAASSIALGIISVLRLMRK
jgi:hypothetical protein